MLDDHAYLDPINPVAADRLVLDIFAKVQSIADLGISGSARPEFGEGMRSITYRERIIFFHVSDSELTVLRVLHGHQDISPDYFKTDEN